MAHPLAGIRVVDFTHVMAGPFATYLLGLLGAEIIKIEPLGGDLFRTYGVDSRQLGMGAYFIGTNAGKKSIALDLKHPAALQIVRELIAGADVVVQNFRPGVIDKLGFGYAACRALKDDIIFCSVSGYGLAGPMRDYPAVDNVVQATSGMMSVSGEEGDPPQRIGVPAVDTYTATCAATAVLAAIVQRERFGGGQSIDVAMMDCSLVLLYGAVMPYLIDGRLAPKTGNTGFSAQPTAGLFQARDGKFLSLGAVQQSQYLALCEALERPDLAADARFAGVPERRANASALTEQLRAALRTRDAEEWERLLSDRNVPCGVVRTVAEAIELPQVRDRGLRIDLPAPAGQSGRIGVLNAPFKFEHDATELERGPPQLGEHTREILLTLGRTDRQIDALAHCGAVQLLFNSPPA